MGTNAGLTTSAGMRGGALKGVLQRSRENLSFAPVMVLILAALWSMGSRDVELLSKILASLLLGVCVYPTYRYLTRAQKGEVPVFQFICLLYGVGYAVPLFMNEPTLWLSGYNQFATIGDNYVRQALTLGILGVVMMQIGFRISRFGPLRGWIPVLRIALSENHAKTSAAFMAGAGIVFYFLMTVGKIPIMERFSAIYTAVSTLTYLSLAVLIYYDLKKQLSLPVKVLSGGLFFALALLGFASGNMAQLLMPFIVYMVVYWKYSQRLPWKLFLWMFFLFVLIQPVKAQYREQVWTGGYAQESVMDRFSLWGKLIGEEWSSILTGGTEKLQDTTRSSLTRGDCLHIFAHVLHVTPNEVPFQRGATYSYLLVSLVPRVFWPDKPIAQDVNNTFAVAYGFLRANSVGTTMVGMPCLVETYINFGAAGVFWIMILVGMVYGAIDRVLGSPESGAGAFVIYVSMMTGLFTIENAMASVFGGLLQVWLVLYLFVRFLCL